jgi:DNA repair protein RecN (Recombination protein N)
MVTSASLGELGRMLVEIAGQHQHQRLGSPSWQRNLLDRFAGARAEELAERVAEAVRLAAGASAAIEALTDGERARTRELDVLRYEIGEIEEVGPLQGEGDRLRAEAARLDGAERTAAGVAGALESLQGEGGADELVARAARALEDVEDPAAAALRQRLRSVALELGDVAGSMAALMVAPDPESLESTRSRLAALAGLERKYGHDESEVLAYLERARARVADLEGAEVDLERHERALEEHRRVAAAAADELSKLRAEAAPRLERAVEKRLATLALEDARFRVVLEQRPLYEGGAEAVELRVAANPGEPIRPVARVASGGELSRISLALHLTTTTEPATTMIFDEVDAGVGGRAARAVGRALAELTRAHGGQAVVVTHLPQVAAEADVHLRVVKETRRGRTGATVERLEGEARVEELSRMLAGLPESERARGHAQELLTMAARAGPS